MTFVRHVTKKEIPWVGSAYDDLVSFPDELRRDTSKQDKDIAEARYRAVVNARKAKNDD